MNKLIYTLSVIAFISSFSVFSAHAQTADNATTSDFSAPAPLVISCSGSKTSVFPDEPVVWTAQLQSGDDPRNFYEWMTEGNGYSSQRGLGTHTDTFSAPGTNKRYILALQTYTTNEIGRFPCGTVVVNKFTLTTPGQQPDLIIDKVYFQPDLTGPISPFGTICADIKNNGTGGSQGTFATQFAQGNLVRSYFNPVPDPGKTVSSCTINYAPAGGVNNISVSIDNEKRIDESKTDNNTVSSQVNIPVIPEASLNLIYPNSGTFNQGDQIEIRWDSKGMADKVRIYYVGIPYTPDKEYTIADSADNNGHYTWKVNTPNVPNGPSRINIIGRHYYDYTPLQVNSSDFIYFQTRTLPLSTEPKTAPVQSNVMNNTSPVFTKSVTMMPAASTSDSQKSIPVPNNIQVIKNTNVPPQKILLHRHFKKFQRFRMSLPQQPQRRPWTIPQPFL